MRLVWQVSPSSTKEVSLDSAELRKPGAKRPFARFIRMPSLNGPLILHIQRSVHITCATMSLEPTVTDKAGVTQSGAISVLPQAF